MVQRNPGVTQNLTKSLHDLGQFTALLTCPRRSNIPIRFATPVRQMKVGRPIWPILPLKLVVMATSLSDPKTNAGFINPFHWSTNPENIVKIDLVVSEITWLIGRPLKHEKIGKTYSPGGLNISAQHLNFVSQFGVLLAHCWTT